MPENAKLTVAWLITKLQDFDGNKPVFIQEFMSDYAYPVNTEVRTWDVMYESEEEWKDDITLNWVIITFTSK